MLYSQHLTSGLGISMWVSSDSREVLDGLLQCPFGEDVGNGVRALVGSWTSRQLHPSLTAIVTHACRSGCSVLAISRCTAQRSNLAGVSYNVFDNPNLTHSRENGTGRQVRQKWRLLVGKWRCC
jgi:hypothetical protein